ncbi:MAG TPA: hypothetical protein VHM31_22295 [Polyangia bacterium]|nr:hypothetical protein [Polyangia bacterium]
MTPSRRLLLSYSLALSTVLVFARTAAGLELGDPESAPTLEVHAFVSQGYAKSTDNDYLLLSSKGSFEMSEAGLNFTSQLTERLRVGIQLFAYDLGKLGNYTARADWFYLDYRLKDWLGLRAGRTKLPFGLYSDVSDIDAARTPILLPQAIYPQTNRYFLLGVTGGSLYGYVNLGRAGALDYRAVGGAIPVSPAQIGAPPEVSSIDIPYVAAGRFLWETPLSGLRLGVSLLVLKLNETGVLPTMPTPTNVSLNDVVYSAIGSVEYAWRDLLIAAEYGQARSVVHDDQPALFPEGATVDAGGYGLVAYRVTKWLQPSVYYSFFAANRNLGDQAANMTTNDENIQDDLAGTLRFDVNDFWIVKVEGHYMHGTAALGAVPTAAPNWGLFLVKTTAYF